MANTDSKVKLIIVVPLWGRPRLSNIMLSYHRNLIEEVSDAVDVSILCAISQDDPYKDEFDLAGVMIHSTSNLMLGRKFNKAYLRCRGMDHDAVMILGSDDFITKSYLITAAQMIKRGADFISLDRVHFYDIRTRTGFTTGVKSMGAGCVMSKKTLSKFKYQPFYGDRSKGVDFMIYRKVRKKGIENIRSVGGSIIKDGPLLLDVKSYRIDDGELRSDNVHSYSVMKTNMRNSGVDYDPEVFLPQIFGTWGEDLLQLYPL